MLKLHILNVGHGDCIVVEFPSGRLSIIDINRSQELDEDSLKEVLSYSNLSKILASKISYEQGMLKYNEMLKMVGYDVNLTDPLSYIAGLGYKSQAFRFISTHPHMDHLTGLNLLLSEIGVTNVWILSNNFTQDLSQLSDSQKNDWKLYQQLRANKVDGITVVRPGEMSQNNFWMQDGIHILAPSNDILKNANKHNDVSYVLLIKYGSTKIVLGGDAEENTWEHIVENHRDDISNITVLKAAHHGRDSGYHQEAIKIMNPDCTVVSVGKKPETDASQKYAQYSNKVLSTRWHGTIRFELNNQGGGSYYSEYLRE